MQGEGQPFQFNFGAAEKLVSANECQQVQQEDEAGLVAEEISTDAEVICCVTEHLYAFRMQKNN